MKTFETDCHVVIDRSDVNLKGLKYKITKNKDTKQKTLVICETKQKMLEHLGNHLFDWAYDGNDHIVFCDDDFFDYSEYNPFDNV